MSEIRIIEKKDEPSERRPLRVAAYCRVSKNSAELLNSLQNQIEHFERIINANPDWIFVGIYYDVASGLRTKNRDGYKKMLTDCRKGKIDMIIIKSFSRFGRDILEMLKRFEELKKLGIQIKIEIGGFNTMETATMATTALMAMAQEESRMKSESIKWGIEKRMRQGKAILNHSQFLGYTKDADGVLVVVPDEAEIVRKIFELYADGNGTRKIKKYLEDNGIKTVTGKSTWSTATLDRMLDNEKYVGHLLLQKTFVPNFLTGKQIKNDGYLDSYFIENDHEPIIDEELWNKVRARKDKS